MPITVITPMISPPAPIPCRARNTISCSMDCARPLSAEPTRKMTIAATNSVLRGSRSPILPQIGVDTVVVSR